MTSSKHVATVQGCPVRQLVDSKILPFHADKQGGNPLTSEQEQDETRYLSLLHTVLHCGFFYFSYDYDLTLSTQRIAAIRTDPAASALPLWRRADARFMWNGYVLRDLAETGADEFMVPLMNGYVFQQHQKVRANDVTFVLISRRSHERTGRRFIMRGLDSEGHAANTAETEQIVFITDPSEQKPLYNATRVASFVQTRGSIPVLWEQPVTLKYTPKITFQVFGRAIDPRDDAARRTFQSETLAACRKHFASQIALYGKQICLNLVNQKGAELALVKAFKLNVDALGRSDIRLVNWDFHQECRKMKYENINKLFDLVRDDLDAMSYFLARVSSTPGAGGRRGVEWEVLKRQSGTIRTNCIDCLDRTNVVQSVFARKVLDRQLAELCGYDATRDRHASFDSMFRNVWANNADAMSLQYSGTGALKTDYTRTGKRSIRGALMDGVNSLTRYYLNNFRDGRAQDALDLFLGVYQPSPHAPSPYAAAKKKTHPAHQKSVLQFALSFTAALLLVLVAWGHVAPPTLVPHRTWPLSAQLAVFAVVESLLGIKLIMRYGKDYANKPVLRNANLK